MKEPSAGKLISGLRRSKILACVVLLLYPVSKSIRLYRTASFHNYIKETGTWENLCAGKTVVNKILV